MTVALTIAGSDPSGGAGIQADLKTFHRFGVFGEAVVTLITVQNTRGIDQVHLLPADLVEAQIRAVIEDLPPRAAKTGALGSREIAGRIAKMAEQFEFPLVVDPVMSSKNGVKLGGRMMPCFLLTPNLEEASTLAGFAVDDLDSMRRGAEKIHSLGAENVLIKGGHLRGDAVDLLYARGEFHQFHAARIDTRSTHGTGCAYSAAITAELAKGTALVEAVRRAKQFVSDAIRTNPALGSGSGPLNFFA